MEIVRHIRDVAQGKHSATTKRSSHWPEVRKAFLLKNPTCAVCGGTDKLEVHHKNPFHIQPLMELDPMNLITLCESGKGGVNCHLHFGHLGNFKSFNADVYVDSRTWKKKITERP